MMVITTSLKSSLFDFDAPSQFIDLNRMNSIPISFHDVILESHDPWFDQPHPNHGIHIESDSIVEGNEKKKGFQDLNIAKTCLNESITLKAKKRKLTEPTKIKCDVQVYSKKQKTTILKTKPNKKKNKKENETKLQTELNDLQALLAAHNKKFKVQHTYEPRHTSLRSIKKWEKKYQKSYSSLSIEERKKANEEMHQWKLEK